MIAYGVVAHEGSYLRSGWNWIDFISVVTAVPSLFTAANAVSYFEVFRMLRILRSLRSVKYIKGMQVMVVTLIKSLPTVANVLLLGVFISFMFAIMGVQLFAGQLYKCNDASVATREECNGFFEYTDNLSLLAFSDMMQGKRILRKRTWCNSDWSFDNVYEAMGTMFMVSTVSDWHQFVWSGMDVQGVGVQPKTNSQPWNALYFVAYTVLSSFCWMNLLISVVVDFYQQARQEAASESLFITAEQRVWLDAVKIRNIEGELEKQDVVRMFNLPEDPTHPRARLLEVVMHKRFEFAVLAIITLDTLSMATQHNDQSAVWTDLQEATSIATTIIFLVEAILKLTAFFPRCYFSHGWNLFDFIVVLVSIVDSLSSERLGWAKLGFSLGGAGSILRIFRMARLFKLVKSARGLRALFNTLLTSLPAVLNVSCLMLLILFVFSVLAMNLFGDLEPGTLSTSLINERYNYRTFYDSLCTLMTVFTGTTVSAQILGTSRQCRQPLTCLDPDQDWSVLGTIQDTTGIPRTCEPSDMLDVGVVECDCDRRFVSFPFFVAYYCLVAYLILTIIMAVMLENFSEQGVSEGLLNNPHVLLEACRKKVIISSFVEKLKNKIETFHEIESVMKSKSEMLTLDILKRIANQDVDGSSNEVVENIYANMSEDVRRAYDSGGMKPSESGHIKSF